MEMFEADVQPIISDYFNGLITQKSFEQESRAWPNYQKDYKPLVEFAKENRIRLIATNVPRRYANAIYHYGVPILKQFPKDARSRYFPKRKFQVKQSRIYKEIAKMAGGHNSENFVASQAFKDATMAMPYTQIEKSTASIQLNF